MAFTDYTNNYLLLVSVFIFTCFSVGNAFDEPNLGAASAVANGYVPQAEAGGTTQFFPQAGIIGPSPLIFSKALRCLSDNHIYSSCAESYRLTESGELHVPPQHTDDYCNGPCVAETHHVLGCISGIFKNFVFYNGATLNNVRDAIESGCGYGPLRGHFNILEHTQQVNGASKINGSRRAIFLFVVVCIGWRLLF